MSIGEYQLLDPWFLLAGPLAVLALWWSGRGRRAALPVASTWFLAGLPRTFRQRLAGLPTILTVLAAFALAVALARAAGLTEDGAVTGKVVGVALALTRRRIASTR